MLHALKYHEPESLAQTDAHDCLAGTPWEGFGANVSGSIDVAEMLRAAGLNWRVLRVPQTLEIPLEELDCEPKDLGVPYKLLRRKDETVVGITNPDSYSLVRASDGTVLSKYIGKRYKHIQNEDAFRVFQDFVEAGQMTMEVAGSLAGGKHIWGLARTGHWFELANGERIESYFLLLQSHAYGYALKAMWTPVRFPGGHTLVQNINKKGIGLSTTFTMSHASKFDDAKIAEIKKIVGIASDAMGDFQKKAEFMAQSKVSEAHGVHYISQVFDTNLIKVRTRDEEPLPQTLKDLAMAPDAGRISRRIAVRAGFMLRSRSSEADAIAWLASIFDPKREVLPQTMESLLKDGMANRAMRKAAEDIMESKDWEFGVGGTTLGSAWDYFSTAQHTHDHVMGFSREGAIESAWVGKNQEAKLKSFNLANVLAQKGD